MAKPLQLRRALRMKRRPKVSREVLRKAHSIAGEFLNCGAHLVRLHRAGAVRHRGAEGDRDRIRHAFRQLPEKLASRETEYAAPDAVKMHWDHGNVYAIEDAFEATFKRAEIAGAGDRTFCENTDHAALGELLARGADGLHHAAAMGCRPGWP